MAGSTTFNQGMSIAVARAFLGEVPLGPQSGNFAIDWSAGNYQSVVLGASGLTITAPSVGVGFFQLKITQDAVGGRTLPTFVPAINWIGGTPVLPIAAGSVDLIQLYSDGANFFGTSLAASNPLELPTLIVGDPGTEAGGITVGGVTYQSVLKVSDLGGANAAEMILHRHSTTIEAVIVGSRSNSNTAAHAAVTAGQNSLSLFAVGYTGADYEIQGEISIGADLTGVISPTSSPGRMIFSVTPDGTVAPVPWLTVTNDGNAMFKSARADFAISLGGGAVCSIGNDSAARFSNQAIAINGLAGQSANFVLRPNGGNAVFGLYNSFDGANTGRVSHTLGNNSAQYVIGAATFGGGTPVTQIAINVLRTLINTTVDDGATTLQVAGSLSVSSAQLIASKTTLTNNAGASAGTLTNAPAAGNPTKWIPINDNGTIRNIPAW